MKQFALVALLLALSHATPVPSDGDTNACFSLLAGDTFYQEFFTCLLPSGPVVETCCPALAQLEALTCFCNPFIIVVMENDIGAFAANVPAIAAACQQPITSGESCNVPNGECGVPDWQIHAARFQFFVGIGRIRATTPFDSDTASTFIEPYVNDETVLTLPAVGSYSGVRDIVEYVAVLNPDANEGSSSLAGEGGYDSASFDRFGYSLALPIPTGVYYDENGAPTFVIQDTGFRMRTDYPTPCSTVVSTAVLEFNLASVTYFAQKIENHLGIAKFCRRIQEACVNNPQYTDVQDCIEYIASLPSIDPRCSDKVLQGSSRGCKMVHWVLAKQNDFHCPHVGKDAMDANGEFKCNSAVQCVNEETTSESSTDEV